MSNAATYENGFAIIATSDWSQTSAIIDVACSLALNTTHSTRTIAKVKCNPRQYTQLLGKLRAEKLVD